MFIQVVTCHRYLDIGQTPHESDQAQKGRFVSQENIWWLPLLGIMVFKSGASMPRAAIVFESLCYSAIFYSCYLLTDQVSSKKFSGIFSSRDRKMVNFLSLSSLFIYGSVRIHQQTHKKSLILIYCPLKTQIDNFIWVWVVQITQIPEKTYSVLFHAINLHKSSNDHANLAHLNDAIGCAIPLSPFSILHSPVLVTSLSHLLIGYISQYST